jgi:hypothetical protein
LVSLELTGIMASISHEREFEMVEMAPLILSSAEENPDPIPDAAISELHEVEIEVVDAAEGDTVGLLSGWRRGGGVEMAPLILSSAEENPDPIPDAAISELHEVEIEVVDAAEGDTVGLLSSWRRGGGYPSLAQAHQSIDVPRDRGWLREFMAYLGPGYCIAVGKFLEKPSSKQINRLLYSLSIYFDSFPHIFASRIHGRNELGCEYCGWVCI